MTRIKANFYQTPAGKEPVREWLKELSKMERHLIGKDLIKIEFAWPVGMPVCEAMGEGLFQVRTNLPNNTISRILFFIENDNMYILHGFIKKTSKTLSKDIDLAKSRKKEILKELRESK